MKAGWRLESKLVWGETEMTDKLMKVFSTSVEIQEIRIILIIRTTIKYFRRVLTKRGLWSEGFLKKKIASGYINM